MPVHLGELPPDEVLSRVGVSDEPQTFVVAGVTYTLKVNSTRLRVFRRSRVCAICGLVGTKMILDLPPDTQVPHFNLYGEEDGNLILFTKDHVQPRSHGGDGDIENMRTACHTCNNIRGNDITLTDDTIRAHRAAGTRPPQDRRSVTRVTNDRPSPKQSVPALAALAAPPVDEENPTSMAWALVRHAYEITGALAVGQTERAFTAAKEAHRLLGKLLGKLRSSSMAA